MKKFYKKNSGICNYFVKKEFVKISTKKASFINLPNYKNNTGFGISNKFIFQNQKNDNLAVGIIYDNNYAIINYNKNCPLNAKIIDYITGTEIINIFQNQQSNFKKYHEEYALEQIKKGTN